MDGQALMKQQNVTSLRGLWISTIGVLLIDAVQGLTGNWATFFLAWPNSDVGNTILQVTARMASYHIKVGFAVGALSILIVVFAFASKSSMYVRIFSVLGLVITLSAVWGGLLFVSSMFVDRLGLGQMADSFVGAFSSYFLMLVSLALTSRFPWSRKKRSGESGFRT
jgi:hypothetical protein